MAPTSTFRDLWLYRDVEQSTRRIVLRARCVDYGRSLWSCDLYVLTHDPGLEGEGRVCEELYHQHLMDTFESPEEAQLRGLAVGMAWVGTHQDTHAAAADGAASRALAGRDTRPDPQRL
jgi:hypothetical protein